MPLPIEIEQIKFDDKEKNYKSFSNNSSYVKDEEIHIKSVSKQKSFASSITHGKTVLNSKKRPSTAFIKNESMLPQRKLPIGKVPSYITKSKESKMNEIKTNIQKLSNEKETENSIYHEDNETCITKNKLLSADSVPNSIENLLLEKKECFEGGDQILFNDSNVVKFTDKINHIFYEKAISVGNIPSHDHLKLSIEKKVMLKIIYDKNKRIKQLQNVNRDLIKRKSKKPKTILNLLKILAQTSIFNGLITEKDKNSIKSSFDKYNLTKFLKCFYSKLNETKELQITSAQLSQENTDLSSKMEDAKHKNVTLVNLLEIRGEIIRNMQNNDNYNRIRIISLLKDIEIEKKKSKELVKLKAATQEEFNNMFSTISEIHHRNTLLEAKLEKVKIEKREAKNKRN